jgi:hypothetical protein
MGLPAVYILRVYRRHRRLVGILESAGSRTRRSFGSAAQLLALLDPPPAVRTGALRMRHASRRWPRTRR